MAIPGEAPDRLDHLQEAVALGDVGQGGGLLLARVPPVVPVAARDLDHVPRPGDRLDTVEAKGDPAGGDGEALVEVAMDVLADDRAPGLDEEPAFERAVLPFPRRLDDDAELPGDGIVERFPGDHRLGRGLEDERATHRRDYRCGSGYACPRWSPTPSWNSPGCRRGLLVRLPESLDVLRTREFRLLFSGQAVSVLGDRMAIVALAFAVLEIGGSASEVGLVLSAGAFPLVATVLAGGVVADRASRRAVMVAADLVRVASQGVMAALLIAGVAEVWMLALVAGVTGAATGFFSPASTGLLPEVVLAEQLQPANALRTSAVSTGEILGPAIGGVLVAAAGAGWAIAIDALSFALSAACLAMLRVPARLAAQRSSFVADLREGWAAFRSRRWVWTFVAYFAFVNLLWGAWGVLGPIVAERDLGGAAAWGTVLAAVGVGALAGSLLAARVRPRRPLLLAALADGLFALPLAFLAAAPPVALIACGALLSGAGMALAISLWESTLQRHVPDESLSRVSSYDWFGSLAFYPLGLAIWGPVAAVIGVSVSLWLAFGLAIAGTVILISVPDIRHLPAVAPPATVASASPAGSP